MGALLSACVSSLVIFNANVCTKRQHGLTTCRRGQRGWVQCVLGGCRRQSSPQLKQTPAEATCRNMECHLSDGECLAGRGGYSCCPHPSACMLEFTPVNNKRVVSLCHQVGAWILTVGCPYGQNSSSSIFTIFESFFLVLRTGDLLLGFPHAPG